MVNVKPRTRHLRFELEAIEDWDRDDEETSTRIHSIQIIGLRRDIE
jgi:hypothetical protein